MLPASLKGLHHRGLSHIWGHFPALPLTLHEIGIDISILKTTRQRYRCFWIDTHIPARHASWRQDQQEVEAPQSKLGGEGLISSTRMSSCCVVGCRNRRTKVSDTKLKFYRIPTNTECHQGRRKLWLDAIKRENWTEAAIGNARVCSAHFISGEPSMSKHSPDFAPSVFNCGQEADRKKKNNNTADREPKSERGRLVREGAASTLEWKKYLVSRPIVGFWGRQPGAAEEVTRSEEGADTTSLDHDYVSCPDPDIVDFIQQLRTRVETFGIHRFASSDKDIRFFTRFASYDHLMRFWALIKPSLPFISNVTAAQKGSSMKQSTAATSSLQRIDEMFLFLNYLALGLKPKGLADRFGIDQFTVTRIIATWSNFLFTILGSVRIWLPVEKILEHLPAEFKDYADTTVILDCTELRCQCPSSLLQSEVVSYCTLKGLLGVAPHGAVTFISPLFSGSIHNKQIMKDSGVLSLLRPGMAIMVDGEFLVDDFVPCKVYRPAFLSGRPQTPAGEFRETQALACLRVHVEGLIRRVKEHKFFNTVIPHQLFGNINQLFAVACLLTNYEN
ncbi:uncharacterized protein LOC125003789 isoform X2 [Mugil cephalus]|uniref:uncharacterized protein LOC125003789 isoform X2 n=2 Tax=Mugil cephalus TaxID=48193 RepID=UPI001FB62EF8|nr:uncharacterized protein LOC125003789 isoform X2 [Mugil cephalus]